MQVPSTEPSVYIHPRSASANAAFVLNLPDSTRLSFFAMVNRMSGRMAKMPAQFAVFPHGQFVLLSSLDSLACADASQSKTFVTSSSFWLEASWFVRIRNTRHRSKTAHSSLPTLHLAVLSSGHDRLHPKGNTPNANRASIFVFGSLC